MKLYLGIPSTKFGLVETIDRILEWAQATTHDLHIKLQTGYGVDRARSVLIDKAKSWGADLLLMIDSDIVPQTTIGECLSYVGQAFARGYGAILSPTLSSTRNIMAWRLGTPFESPRDVPTDSLFEVDWAAMGFCALKREAIDGLKVLGQQTFVNGPPQNLYCLYDREGGEDRSLLRNVRENAGFKIGCDPRIRVIHVKETGIPSWRPELLNAV